ncbi:DUF2490 domain-containing protein [Salinimicrobium oceani]|uniref:DUF2490 domain-containing protein n=1 Tax=Salinimicrobium oceani TaxID=2722702 RepID=A0ABX1CYR5_9FLAO|nr:DUF2490 domain-containing protein [Salinimicrobium oceani]NJW51548.1 DUF2490 domain-containing protein [Salinimicrobium oceani]
MNHLKTGNKLIFKLFLSAGIFILSQNVRAQNSKTLFYENEFSLSIPHKELWSIDVGLGNRGMLLTSHETEKNKGYQHEHVEVNSFLNYEIHKPVTLSLGLRYRLRDYFDPSETNEFRIIEQLEITPSASSLPLSHRIRLEQRFREILVHRLRYAIDASFQLHNGITVVAGTESLYAIAALAKPEAEQRFALSLENPLLKDLELELTLEYRMEDLLRNLAHEFFLITGITLSL